MSPGMLWNAGGGYQPPPPPRLAYGPALVSLTASASFQGICNQQQTPPTALATSSNHPLNRSWDPIKGRFSFHALWTPHPLLRIYAIVASASVMGRDSTDPHGPNLHVEDHTPTLLRTFRGVNPDTHGTGHTREEPIGSHGTIRR